ncbi:MAG: CDP-archaeol synthase [Alphaproteobacteria bacterium]|nr:CDP-archaeol synthase [Alphaproteobacteria bacterium]
MQPVVILQLLGLLMLANGTPVIATKLLGARYSYPVDGNLTFPDGRPLFGRSKTIRGVVLAVLVTTAGAPVIGLRWQDGLVIGSFAMAGDLVSSFVKRRLNRPSSSRASGLDQVPESLFPLLACRSLLSLTLADIAVCVAMFLIGGVLISRLLYAWRLRDRPY